MKIIELNGIQYEEITEKEFLNNKNNPDYIDRWEGGNPDMWSIFEYCRNNGVIPNVTVNGEGITDEIADKLVNMCGAVAVSVYNKDKTYDTVKKLTDKGLTQVNIHQVIFLENIDFVKGVINDIKNDDRLSKLNAIVFLSLKPKGRGKNDALFTPLSQESFNDLIKYAENFKINYGMDSCTAGKYVKYIENSFNKDFIMNMIEPCESTRFSIYINTKGYFYPCSFMEEENTLDGGNWEEGIDVVNCNDFLKDVWMNEKTEMFRKSCLNCVKNNNGCLHYKI